MRKATFEAIDPEKDELEMEKASMGSIYFT